MVWYKSIMKKIIFIVILLLLSGVLFLTAGYKKSAPESNAPLNNVGSNNSPAPKSDLSLPLTRALERITKKPFGIWIFVFPNLGINIYPWGISITAWEPIPDDPGHTLMRWYHLVSDENKYELRDKIWLNGRVDREDLKAVRTQQEGYASGYAVRQKFSEYDDAKHWFHRKIAAEP